MQSFSDSLARRNRIAGFALVALLAAFGAGFALKSAVADVSESPGTPFNLCYGGNNNAVRVLPTSEAECKPQETLLQVATWEDFARLHNDLVAEEAARKAADVAIHQRIDAVEAALAQEIQARMAAIAAEKAAREQADAAEKSARESADGNLQQQLNAEAAARQSGDANLQGQINQINAELAQHDAAINALNTNIVTGLSGGTCGTIDDDIAKRLCYLTNNSGEAFLGVKDLDTGLGGLDDCSSQSLSALAQKACDVKKKSDEAEQLKQGFQASDDCTGITDPLSQLACEIRKKSTEAFEDTTSISSALNTTFDGTCPSELETAQSAIQFAVVGKVGELSGQASCLEQQTVELEGQFSLLDAKVAAMEEVLADLLAGMEQ